MAAPWKIVLIGGEITVLAAFTGIGVHLAMQPHRQGLVPPPSLLLPAAVAPAPSLTPSAMPTLPPAATPKTTPLTADWIGRFGREDRHLVTSQWNILEGLMRGVERYLRDRVVPELERHG